MTRSIPGEFTLFTQIAGLFSVLQPNSAHTPKTPQRELSDYVHVIRSSEPKEKKKDLKKAPELCF